MRQKRGLRAHGAHCLEGAASRLAHLEPQHRWWIVGGAGEMVVLAATGAQHLLHKPQGVYAMANLRALSSRLGRHAGVACAVCLVAVPLAHAQPAAAELDTTAQIQRARVLEGKQLWAEARQAWERVIDTCPATEEQRLLAVRRLHSLNDRVAPQTDPANANVWRCYVAIFRTLDFSWKDKEGKQQQVHIVCTDEEIDLLKRGFQRFSELVFEYSRGGLRLEYDIDVLDEPLTRLSGEGSFWLGPWDVEKLIQGRWQPGQVDSVFAYAKLSDGGQQKVPAAMFGGTFGGDYGPGDAGWTGIMWYPGWMDGGGEVELHEWLHQVDWAFSQRLGYPDAVVPSSDDGRKVGEEGGDPDYRREPFEANWLRFYRHFMSEHITSRMWQEARCRPWEGTEYNRAWLVLGPFPYDQNDQRALDREYARDLGFTGAGAFAGGGLTGKLYQAEGDFVDLEQAFGATDYAVAYAYAEIASDRPQKVQLCLGHDDAIIAYLNGERVFRCDGPSPASKDQAKVNVRLRQGTNRVLLKILEITGGWGFYARLGGADGRGVTDARWVVPQGRVGPIGRG